MSNDNTIHLINFTSEGLSIEQEIVIPLNGNQDTPTSIDDVVSGLNAGTIIANLDYNHAEEEQWIRDQSGYGVAIILRQCVTTTGDGYKDFEHSPGTVNEAEPETV